MVTFVLAIRRFAAWADETLRAVSGTALQRYQCERHYMRGPGPKWYAKHNPKPERRNRKGPLTRALDLIAHLCVMIVEGRASQALLGARPLVRRCHVSTNGYDDHPISR